MKSTLALSAPRRSGLGKPGPEAESPGPDRGPRPPTRSRGGVGPRDRVISERIRRGGRRRHVAGHDGASPSSGARQGFAGTVEAVGDDASAFAVGQAVVGVVMKPYRSSRRAGRWWWCSAAARRSGASLPRHADRLRAQIAFGKPRRGSTNVRRSPKSDRPCRFGQSADRLCCGGDCREADCS